MTIRERVDDSDEVGQKPGEIVEEGIYAVIEELHDPPLTVNDFHQLAVQVIHQNRVDLRLTSEVNSDPKGTRMTFDNPTSLRCVILNCPKNTSLYMEQINQDSRINELLFWSQ